MKQNILFLISSLLIISCFNKPKETLISKDCKLKISISGGLGGGNSTAWFNRSKNLGDSLWVIKSSFYDSTLVKTVFLDSMEKDSLFEFVEKIRTNFHFAEAPVVYDGCTLEISISSSANTLSLYFHGFNENTTTPEITNLIDFINRRLPKEIKM